MQKPDLTHSTDFFVIDIFLFYVVTDRNTKNASHDGNSISFARNVIIDSVTQE